MSPMVWFAVGILVVVAASAIVVSVASKRAESQLSAVRQEMQNSLATQGQNVAAQISQQFSQQIGNLMQTVTQQLGQVRQELQSGVATSGQLATSAQQEVAKQLRSSMDALLQMSQKIGEVHQTSQDLSKATQTLQTVLGGVKTRGMLGEIALERILEDALPQGAYEIQYRFASTGAAVDAIIRIGERMLCIDSKFPLEAYRRLLDVGDEARRDFSLAVRKHADSIAEKYILPDEHTFDYALMFVPSEGVFYELIMTQDTKYGALDEYCRSKRVYPVSPNTVCAIVGSIAMSLQGQKLEENARHLLANLSGLQKQLDTFADVYGKLGTHLRNAQQNYEDADSKLNRARNSLEQMSQGALTDGEPKALETATTE
jgi:DNA recombination protein RmuC